MNTTKLCTKCNQTKDITDFGKRKDSKDGYTYECKSCTKIKSSMHYQKNKITLQQQHKEYYQNKKKDKEKNEENIIKIIKNIIKTKTTNIDIPRKFN